MAQYVSTEIDIEGRLLKQFTSLTLSQGIFEHHSFRIVCPAEAIDGTSGAIFNTSKNIIGSTIKISIDAVGITGTQQFAGVVTQVETSRQDGFAGNVIITGYSPTILLDSGPHCKSWEEKNIKSITDDVLKHFPSNLLQPKLSPVYGDPIIYAVQYKETAWQFLCRLHSAFGEWWWYDGQQLLSGMPNGKAVKLIYGNNLQQFNMSLQVRPPAFQLMAYDYMNHEVYEASPASISSKAGLNDLGKHTLQKSEQFYATQPKLWYNQFLTNKKQLDDFANTVASMQSSAMVRFNGSSDHPAIQVGGFVDVQGKNIFNQGDEAYGEYVITSVSHYCDGQGNYSNDFVASPSSVKMPPVITVVEPNCETQSALVTDNNDPDGLGRVRAKFHWMNGSEKSPWMRVTTPHAGDGKGMFFMPEVGEEVIVGFEGDSAVKPYVIGSVFHGKAKNSFANGGNDVKTFQSRSGNKMVLDDKAGSVMVQDKDNNTVHMDGAGNVSILSNTTITLSCGKGGASSITLDKDGNIMIQGKDITLIASANVALGAGAAKDDSLDGSGVNIDPNNISIGAKQKCEIGAGTEMSIVGATASVAANGETTIQGSKVNIN